MLRSQLIIDSSDCYKDSRNHGKWWKTRKTKNWIHENDYNCRHLCSFVAIVILPICYSFFITNVVCVTLSILMCYSVFNVSHISYIISVFYYKRISSTPQSNIECTYSCCSVY